MCRASKYFLYDFKDVGNYNAFYCIKYILHKQKHLFFQAKHIRSNHQLPFQFCVTGLPGGKPTDTQVAHSHKRESELGNIRYGS